MKFTSRFSFFLLCFMRLPSYVLHQETQINFGGSLYSGDVIYMSKQTSPEFENRQSFWSMFSWENEACDLSFQFVRQFLLNLTFLVRSSKGLEQHLCCTVPLKCFDTKHYRRSSFIYLINYPLKILKSRTEKNNTTVALLLAC